jgi:hypothetical protein
MDRVKNPDQRIRLWAASLGGFNGLSPLAAVRWSYGVMKRPIQVEIQAFAFANTPILQYSKTARNFSCRAIEL